MDIRFQNAEAEYHRLRAQLAAGQITLSQFEAALQRLTFADVQGRYWTLHRDTGRWLMFNGQMWVEAVPPGAGSPPRPLPPVAYPMPIAPSAAPQPAKRGCGLWFLLGCLGLLVVLVVAAAGGYYAYVNGYLTLPDVLNLVGQGPAVIEVNNFRDDPIHVTVTQVDTGEEGGAGHSLELQPFDVRVAHPANPGRYRVDFGTSSGATDLGTCTLTVHGGDEYQFVTTPELIVVNRVNNPPATGPDLVLTTSSLCR